MNLRLLALTVIVAAGSMACSQRPVVPDFYSGGFIGSQCPPASEPDGTCSGNDCNVGCVANTPCSEAEAQCPLGTTCDTSLDDPYCMPTETCDTAADCTGGAYCARQGFSKGLCIVVEDPTCANGKCDWPFSCTDGSCALPCTNAECPTGMSCEENRCQPN